MIAAIVLVALGVWLIHIGREAYELAAGMQQDANNQALDAKYGGTDLEPFRISQN